MAVYLNDDIRVVRWRLSRSTCSFSTKMQVCVLVEDRVVSDRLCEVKKGLTCTFRARCLRTRLSWALVLTWVIPFVQDKTNKVGFRLGEKQVISLRHDSG